MADLQTDLHQRVRNVVLLGHSGAGKTTVAEALLARAGAVPRAGTVDDGTSALDTEPESVKRKISLSLAVAPFDWTASDGVHVPGEPPRHARLRRLRGRGGGRAGRRRPRGVRGERGRRRGGADRAAVASRASRAACRAWSSSTRRTRSAPTSTVCSNSSPPPSGRASRRSSCRSARRARLHGIADVLSEEAFEYEPGGTHHSEPLPADVADEEHRLHDAIVEEIVTGDDEQLERYLSGDALSVAELERTLRHEVLDLLEFPVLLGSAATGVGRRSPGRLHLRARPVARRSPGGGDGRRRAWSHVAGRPGRQAAAARVQDDRRPVRRSAVGVQGAVAARCAPTTTWSTAAPAPTSGCTACSSLRGKEQIAGHRGRRRRHRCGRQAAPRHTGDTLAPKGSPVRVATRRPAGAAVRRGDRAAHPGRRRQAGQRARPDCRPRTRSLRGRPQRRDPPDGAARRRRHPRRGRARAPGAQVRRQRRHRRRCGCAYRETIAGTADAEGKVKKQSGGHGQYAVAQPARVAHCRAARASSSSTPSSAARSRATSSPPCRRASRRRW